MMKTIWTLAACAVALVSSPVLANEAAPPPDTGNVVKVAAMVQKLAEKDADLDAEAATLFAEYRKLVDDRHVADAALKRFIVEYSTMLSKLPAKRRAAIHHDLLALRFDHDLVKRLDYFSWIRGNPTRDEALLAAQGWPCEGVEAADAEGLVESSAKARAIVSEMTQWMAAEANVHAQDCADCDGGHCDEVKHHRTAEVHCVDCDEASA